MNTNNDHDTLPDIVTRVKDTQLTDQERNKNPFKAALDLSDFDTRGKMVAIPNSPPAPSALTEQIGGDHYRTMAIQPIEYIVANRMPFIDGNIVKYISRWRTKDGIKDLLKIRHYLDILIEYETKDKEQKTP